VIFSKPDEIVERSVVGDLSFKNRALGVDFHDVFDDIYQLCSIFHTVAFEIQVLSEVLVVVEV